MDVTDDGLALVAKDGGIYFADGASTEQDRGRWPSTRTSATRGEVGQRRVVARVVHAGRARDLPRRVRHPRTPSRRAHTGPRLPPGRMPARRRSSATASTGPTPPTRNRSPPVALSALDVPSGTVLQTDEAALSADVRGQPARAGARATPSPTGKSSTSRPTSRRADPPWNCVGSSGRPPTARPSTATEASTPPAGVWTSGSRTATSQPPLPTPCSSGWTTTGSR